MDKRIARLRLAWSRFAVRALACLLGMLGLCDAALAQSWTFLENEGASFSVNGTQTVRFGAGTAWVQMSVTGSGQCTAALFGCDPA